MEREILPCPTLSLHTHFEETCGASFSDAHGTEILLSIAHAIQGSRNTLQILTNEAVSITSGLSPLLVLS